MIKVVATAAVGLGLMFSLTTTTGDATETHTYAYDEFGRLVTVGYTGTINNGQKHSICYDSTDNRTRYRSDPSGAGADCPAPVPVPSPPPPSPPPPPPPPPPPNNPPVANADTMSAKKCEVATKNLTANDTDADGDYPLTVTSVGTTSLGELAILGGGTVSFTAYGTTGTAAVTYTIVDSRGASANGSLQVTVTNGTGCQ